MARDLSLGKKRANSAAQFEYLVNGTDSPIRIAGTHCVIMIPCPMGMRCAAEQKGRKEVAPGLAEGLQIGSPRGLCTDNWLESLPSDGLLREDHLPAPKNAEL